MPKYKLLEMKQNMTTATVFPGNFQFIISVGLGFLAFLDEKIMIIDESGRDENCNIGDLRKNRAI